MATKPLPDISLLRERLICLPEAGILIWRERALNTFAEPYRAKIWNKRYAGREALGYVSVGGYKTGHIGPRTFVAHRVIWAMVNEKDPGESEIDHINGDTADNRISNLRRVTHAVNAKNQRRCKHNTTGANGVHLVPSGRFHARTTVHGKRVSVGTFDTLEEAMLAQKASSIAAGYHPNHGR